MRDELRSCSDSGLPRGPSRGPVSKDVATTGSRSVRHDTAGMLIPCSELDLHPMLPFTRLDRPPESLISG